MADADPVADLLRKAALSDAQRADLWDAYQKAATPDDLAAALKPLKLPNPIKADLWDLKAAPPAATAPAAAAPAPVRTWGDTATDLGIGAVKGLGNTVTGLGEAFYRYVPGVSQLSDLAQRAMFGDVQPAEPLFAGARQGVQPTNVPQQIGYMGEQVGEFFLPTGAVGRAAKAAEIAKAGGLTLAQTGSPGTAAASSALTAILPGAGAVRRASGALEASAEKSVAGALGATKEWAKTEAAELAPEMLKRGVRGSRAEMLEQARTMTAEVGKKIGAEIEQAAAADTTIPGAGITQVLEDATQGLMITTAGGKTLPIAGTEPVIRQLGKLRDFVQQLGPDIPIDQAAKIKTVWQRIVSKAGLYGPKAQASATDSAAGWSVREAAGAFKKLLDTGNTTLADLNQEYAFWKGLRSVLSETERRTQAQGAGLISGVTGGAGLVSGLVSGESIEDKLQKGVLYGLAGRQLVRVLQSPAWQTKVAAPLKQSLADALASGSAPRVASVLKRITASLPAQLQSAATMP